MRLAVSAMAMFFIMSGCADPSTTEDDVRSFPPVLAQVQPEDLTTRVGEAELVVTLRRNGPQIPDELVASVADQLTVTFDGVPIESSVITDPAPPPNTFLDYRRVIRVAGASRQDGWHTLSFGPVVGVESDGTFDLDARTGRFAARFHPNSHPLVRSVTACPAGGTSPAKVLVDLSEPGVADHFAMDIHSDGASCVLNDTGTVSRVAYTCPMEPGAARVHVRLVRLATPEGVLFNFVGTDVRELGFEVDSGMPAIEGECHMWRLSDDEG